MPDMDGLQLARAIRADQGLAGLRLLMLTSVGYDADVPGAPDVDSWVTKPIRKNLLRQALLGLIQEQPHIAAAPASDETVATDPSSAEARHILLVEDTPVNREVATGMLQVLGYEVYAVDNGRLAVDVVSQRSFDLILMDCQMPEMDGFTATAAIRRQESQSVDRRPVPIIALTANAMEGDRARCLAAGMDDYLAKPFTLAQLKSLLTPWLTPTSPHLAAVIPPVVSQSTSAASPLGAQPPPVAAEIDKTAWDAILSLQRPGRPDLLARILTTYLDDSRLLVEHIRTAVQTQNSVALSEAAHRLKSSSAQLGAVALAAHCNELETLGRLARVAEAAPLLTHLIDAHQAACAIMATELHLRAAA